jgi:hypothetical protein
MDDGAFRWVPESGKVVVNAGLSTNNRRGDRRIELLVPANCGAETVSVSQSFTTR